jgi:hypothetical protein
MLLPAGQRSMVLSMSFYCFGLRWPGVRWLMLDGPLMLSHCSGLRWPGVRWLIFISAFFSLHFYQALIAVNVWFHSALKHNASVHGKILDISKFSDSLKPRPSVCESK